MFSQICRFESALNQLCLYSRRNQKNLSALTSTMLDRKVIELTNHSRTWSIWAGLAVVGPVIKPWCGARKAGSQSGWKYSQFKLFLRLNLLKILCGNYCLLTSFEAWKNLPGSNSLQWIFIRNHKLQFW